RQSAGNGCTRRMQHSCPPVPPALPRCWKSCGMPPARTTSPSPWRLVCCPRSRTGGGRRPRQPGRARTRVPLGQSTPTSSSGGRGGVGGGRGRGGGGVRGEGGALVIGHSPTNEAAVLGLAGQVVPPLGKGEGILLTEDGGNYQADPLD